MPLQRLIRNNGYRFTSTASIGFKTSIVAVAVLQFAGMTFNPVEGFTQFTLLYNLRLEYFLQALTPHLNQYSMDLKKLYAGSWCNLNII
jgi:hypothetical protein